MSQFPETHESLLVQVRSPANAEAWYQFSLLYRPVIYRLARQRGLQDADAQDLAQQVLIAVASAVGNYEKSGAGVQFRHWLRRIARNAIVNALSRRPPDLGAGGSWAQEVLEQESDEDQSDVQFEQEFRREIYLRAARIVRGDVEPETWRAFEMTVVENQSIEEAAAELGKPVGSIYAARSRVMRRLREAVQELERSQS